MSFAYFALCQLVAVEPFVAVTIAKHVILERLLLLAPWVDPWCAPWRGAMVRAMAPQVVYGF